MTLSKRATRPAQTGLLLDRGILPDSLDYRFCHETNLIDGPMTNVRNALLWAQSDLAVITQLDGIRVDPTKVVVIRWSTGGYSAMANV